MGLSAFTIGVKIGVYIIRLPVEQWQDYRDLRLRALKEDPQAYSSSYADALGFPEERWTTRLREAEAGEHSWLLFARDGGKLVGMIGAYIEDASEPVVTIVSVYVPVEERGRGISRLLMEAMLHELSRRPSLMTVTLTLNKTQLPALRLYEKFGFKQVRTQPGTTGDGKPAEELVMERPLPYSPATACV